MRKAIFLDRDGTLIEDIGYAHNIEDFKLFPDAILGLRMLKGEYAFFIITNQSGIGMGLFTEHDFKRYNDYLIERLREQEITIEKTYFCPHTGGCDCRKPSTKFIEDIVREYRVDLSKSWVIGDHPSDVVMGINAGCRTVYLLTGHGKKHFQELESGRVKPNIIAPDFLTAAKGIKKHEDRDTEN